MHWLVSADKHNSPVSHCDSIFVGSLNQMILAALDRDTGRVTLLHPLLVTRLHHSHMKYADQHHIQVYSIIVLAIN